METNKIIHNKIKIINKTLNGKLFVCSKCNRIHLEFGNMVWTFRDNQFMIFKEFIDNINGEYFEIINKDTHYQRKIMIPIEMINIKIAFNIEELKELKLLLSDKEINITKQLINFNNFYSFN